MVTQMAQPPELIIFDCDGVLVDSEPATNLVLAENLSSYGLPMTPEEASRLFVGGTMKSVMERARSMGADLHRGWLDEIYGSIFRRLAEGLPPIPHLDALFAAIDRVGTKTCIASNGPLRKMEITLPAAGLMERFKGRIYSAHDVGIAKPAPGLFEHACAAMNSTPEDCVVIEDSSNGAKAAYDAGMRCFGYTADTPPEELTQHGAIPFSSMADLPGLLGLAP